jgi:hypothetical protein
MHLLVLQLRCVRINELSRLMIAIQKSADLGALCYDYQGSRLLNHKINQGQHTGFNSYYFLLQAIQHECDLVIPWRQIA